jgi:hypothetical protein
MKKILNIFTSFLWIVFFAFAFVPALIILIVTDIREDNRTIRMFCKDNFRENSNKKVISSKQHVSDTVQFIPDPV